MDLAWSALGLSLKVAGWATALNLVLGVGVGFLLARVSFPGRDLLDTVLTLPMVMPPTVLGYYLLVVLGRRGWLGSWLQDAFGINLIFTWQGAVIAATIVAFPLVFKPARAAFEAVDGQLEQAAGVLLAFARALGEFGATLMIAGSIPGKTQTLSVAVYEAVQAGQDEVANTLVLITSAVCIVVLMTAGRLAPGRIANR
jgi:molybdate transport system permease protein